MSDSVQSRSEGILRDTIDGTSEYPHKKGKSRIEDLLIELLEEGGGGGGGDSTIYATSLSLTINPSTFVMTAQLLNKNGDTLGTAQTIDLPLESVVVNGAYDSQTKKVVLTLQNGNTIEFSVADLVDGLQTEITSANKLSADLVDDTTSTNKFVTAADKTAWNGKQDAISDLSTIRSNATAGAGAATVVQGIGSTGNNYIELKSGQREYLAITVPTGNIPTGSVGMGFDEGVFTYESGTKVSEGEPNLTYGKQFSFYANGQPLADYTIYGETGGVGDKTAQLFDVSTVSKDTSITWATGATILRSGYDLSDYIPVEESKTYTCSKSLFFVGYDSSKNYLGTYNEGVWDKNGNKLTTTFANSSTLVAAYIRLLSGSGLSDTVMLNEGSIAQTFEPFGYKIPVICGGQTTNIYLASPLGDGDSIDYATAQVDIPTVDGANNLICDTSVQPSKVFLTYTGWHSDDTTARKVTGITETGNDHIKMGNGITLYISATQPQNPSEGDLWIGG